jgi:hypothetical protein
MSEASEENPRSRGDFSKLIERAAVERRSDLKARYGDLGEAPVGRLPAVVVVAMMAVPVMMWSELGAVGKHTLGLALKRAKDFELRLLISPLLFGR